MAYTPHTASDVDEMLKAIGLSSTDDLFHDIPADLLLREPLELPAHSEFEVDRYMEERASENRIWPAGRSFLGAGAYHHFIPAASYAIVSRGEFMTCYTPYQAEVSQGTLQVIYEFQSHICALTGLDVANASMYDGPTALAEALLMALREKRHPVVYLPELLHPAWRDVCRTFMEPQGVEIRTIPAHGSATDFEAMMDSAEQACAVVVATPNCLGGIEDAEAARRLADRAGALLVAAVNPTALAVLAPPGAWGADIAVGEAQPLGIPLSYGGPYAGFMACRESLIRKMPGRIVGRTTDKTGRPGFVLTLQTREQHIRRDKATSNICTNQGLFALMATVYMTLMGREGLVEVAESCMARTQQLVERLTMETAAELEDAGTPSFHEAVLRLPVPASTFIAEMKEKAGILAGFPLERWFPDHIGADHLLLVNCTEVVSPEDIDRYVKHAKALIGTKNHAGVH